MRQCALLGLSRSSPYHRPAPADPAELALMGLIDRQYRRTPFYGSRRMAARPRGQGHAVNRRRGQRLMRRRGLEAIHPPRPRTSRPAPEHRAYPYLLRGRAIERANQVWCADLTYIPMARGFLDRVAVMAWVSRRVLRRRLSDTMAAAFGVAALEAALGHGRPEMVNTDQGRRFTSAAFPGGLEAGGIAISLDGRGRFTGDIVVERLWRSLKYEEIDLRAYGTVAEARAGIGAWLRFYDEQRLMWLTVCLGLRLPLPDGGGGGAAADGRCRAR